MKIKILIIAVLAIAVASIMLMSSSSKKMGSGAIKLDKDYSLDISKEAPKGPIIKHNFKVCNVKTAQKALEEESMDELLEFILEKNNMDADGKAEKSKTEVLCHSEEPQKNLVGSRTNALMLAAYMAYADHRPLVLSPDMIWLAISQGLALHVNQNAEELRHLFVDHEGQIAIEVERAFYQPTNKEWWQGIFPEFSKKIGENTKGELMEMATPAFSTTTFSEKAAFEITLMDAMSSYFVYKVNILCGIPEITVEGSPEDWEMIEKRLDQLETYNLDWWVDELRPIIKEFKLASEGKENRAFWKNIFSVKTEHIGCASETFYQGWLFKLYPYLKAGVDDNDQVKYRKNNMLIATEEEASPSILDLDNIPNGISKAKVLLDDNGRMSILYFNAGFIGIEQDKETMALRPNIEWYVTDTHRQPTEEEIKKTERKS